VEILDQQNNVLEVNNLTVKFKTGKKGFMTAVDGVSFNIKKNEIFGLVGESGCGKTTTGRSIIRLYDPVEGEIKFKGRVISGKLDRKKKKYITDNIAMTFQDPISSLNPRMTVREIIAEGLKIRGVKQKSKLDEKILSILSKVGLVEEHASRYPHEFSGGQRQRIGIARALVVNPSLIIADEPISALDVSIQAQIINLLYDLKDELDISILFVAHDLSVVKYFSDRIGVMYAGKLVEVAEADDLYRNPLHPYTKALLSAIPKPTPYKNIKDKTIVFNSKKYDFSLNRQMRAVADDHYVLCSEDEYQSYIEDYS
jgi:ABC-type microcin C transport system duplicated ATPase subunit YejF